MGAITESRSQALPVFGSSKRPDAIFKKKVTVDEVPNRE